MALRPARRLQIFLAAALLPLLLAGCGATQSARERLAAADRTNAQGLAQRGYQPVSPATDIVSARFKVLVEGSNWPVTVVRPSSEGAHPLVLYLPGLGESDQAGAVWRQAWAGAGYAVLSVQALAEDESAWRSELARGAEFHALAQQRFGDEALQQRLAHLEQIWLACRQAARAGQAPLAGLDFSAVAVAGFDLGAQTSVALLAQPGPARDLASAVRVVLAFSPVDDQALPAAPGTSASPPIASQPILSLTAVDDVDPTGWLSPLARRQALFERWPAPGSALLLLTEAGHAVLAGNPRMAAVPERYAPDEAGAAQPRRAAGRQRMGDMPGGPEAIDPIVKVQDATHLPVAERHGPQELETALATVTVAYLDATLRRRESARRWLNEQAQPWLGDLGTWRTR